MFSWLIRIVELHNVLHVQLYACHATLFSEGKQLSPLHQIIIKIIIINNFVCGKGLALKTLKELLKPDLKKN